MATKKTPGHERRAKKMKRACEQYGYAGGCIVPGCQNGPVLHHFVPRRIGGSDGLSNLIPICKQHEVPLHRAGRYARLREGGELAKAEGFRSKVVYPKAIQFQWGCADCLFGFTTKPKYCEVCKTPAGQLSCIRSDSPTLATLALPPKELSPKKQRREDRKEAQAAMDPGDALFAEQLQFDKLQRLKNRKRFSKYGGHLRTNLAAPFIVQLRAQIKREANGNASTEP